MAVIYCPDCKKEMSDTAPVCPSCGYPYAQKKALYQKAVKLMEGCTSSDGYLGVAELFHGIPEFQDAENLEKNCREKASVYYQQEQEQAERARQERIQAEQELAEKLERERLQREQERIKQEQEKKLKREEKEEKRKIFLKKCRVPVAIVLLLALVGTAITQYVIPNVKYTEAKALVEQGKYSEAQKLLSELGGFKDAQDMVVSAWDKEHSISCRQVISAGGFSTVALKEDGTVVATDKDILASVAALNDIVSLSSNGYDIMGLKGNGTVSIVGNDAFGLTVGDWKDIVAVSMGACAVGLKSDGTVVAEGNNRYGQCDVESWENIVAISAGGSHTVGLKSDGTVVATGFNNDGRCDVSSWNDIVAISAGGIHTVGLKSDGTVVTAGYSCDVSKWKDIVAIATGKSHTVGLKKDGTVIASGVGISGEECAVSDWEDIVAISAGESHTVGVKSDGTVVATGSNQFGQCNVSSWTDIKIPS